MHAYLCRSMGKGVMYTLANYVTHAYLCKSKRKGASGSKRAIDLMEATDLKEMPIGRLHLESHPFATGWSGNVVRGMYDGVAIAVKLALVGTHQAEVSLFQDYFEGYIMLAFHNRKMYQLTWYCCICCMQSLINEASAYLKL